MFLLRVIWCCCLLSVSPVTGPFHTKPVIKIVFTPDRRPENPLSDSLFYKVNRKLRWSDFKATPPIQSKSAAVSYTSFAYEGNSLHKKDTLLLNLTLQVFFVKSASWAKPIAMDASGLAHEQLHFDITWLVALRFQQRIKAMLLTIEDYDSIIQYQYLESFREMNRLQEAYDSETNHGQSPAAQLKWQQTIAEALTAITVEGALTGSDSFISSLEHF
ncbi:hypothetical protein SAMN05518672_10966 [Chitinophaga sp. CF118]|uniref:hypothetical protein n=1 Tax=Chitinophaga sp. CF118 TaxID=1884367 RepID=UPI0008E2FE96|nr:hypothetical protein [Chitinophaga sp. CF118]SFE68519.1 hypothetical protein SAMN05518672_10966 [Chitinophaga sp. CF118]